MNEGWRYDVPELARTLAGTLHVYLQHRRAGRWPEFAAQASIARARQLQHSCEHRLATL